MRELIVVQLILTLHVASASACNYLVATCSVRVAATDQPLSYEVHRLRCMKQTPLH
jgi:hypothetical protein